MYGDGTMRRPDKIELEATMLAFITVPPLLWFAVRTIMGLLAGL